MVAAMLPPRRGAVLLVVTLLLQPGCALYRGAKAVVSPVGAATDLVVATGTTAATTAGTVGATTGTAVAGTGRVVISGAGTAASVSASTLSATGSVAGGAIQGTGSLAGGTVRATGSVGGSTISTTGNMAGSSIRGTGRVAVSGMDASTRVARAGVEAAGDVTAQTIRNLSQFSRTGMVTFVDFRNGSVVRIPWRAGLNVYGGGALAQVETAERALAVVRDGRLVFNTLRALATARAFPLQPGDVLRLADRL